MPRESQPTRSTGLLSDLGRSDVGRSAAVGFLVAWAMAQLAGALATSLIGAVAGESHDRDEMLQAVLALVTGLVMIAACVVAVWIGGRVARRMASAMDLLPRVARAYAWTLGILGGAVVLGKFMWMMHLEAMSTPTRAGRSPGISAADYVQLVTLTIVVLAMPLAGRVAVLGLRPRGRRAGPRGAAA